MRNKSGKKTERRGKKRASKEERPKYLCSTEFLGEGKGGSQEKEKEVQLRKGVGWGALSVGQKRGGKKKGLELGEKIHIRARKSVARRK